MSTTTVATPPESVLPSLPRTSTPRDYFRPAASLSAQVAGNAMPVGLLACQRDPLLSELDTVVVSVKKDGVDAAKVEGKANGEAASGGKKKKNGGAKGGEENWKKTAEVWQVQLSDTALFPEGGGQPSDMGTLQVLTSNLPPLEVESVLRRNLDAVHYVRVPNELVQEAGEALVKGAKVKVVVEWSRRRDHMEQHTGQHLLSALLEALPSSLSSPIAPNTASPSPRSIPTLAWALTVYPSPCYIELPRAPTSEELAWVEERMAELIAEGKKVWVEAKSGQEKLESMPKDYGMGEGGGVVRTVEIDGLDRNPCCGTHFPSLSFLSIIFVLPETTSVRGTNVRLYFLAGGRASHRLRTLHSAVRRTAAAAGGCLTEELGERVESLAQKEREGKRREKALREEIAAVVAQQLVDEVEKRWREIKEETKGGGPCGTPTVVLHREQEATSDLEFLTLVSRFFASPEPPASGTTAPHLVLLLTGPSAPLSAPSSSAPSLLLFGSDPTTVAEAGKALVQAVGKERVKGGGKGRWQGKLVGEARWAVGEVEKIREAAVGAGEARATA